MGFRVLFVFFWCLLTMCFVFFEGFLMVFLNVF